jgi:predicted component of type VI protein secretion system
MIEKLEKRRERWLERLLETREAKAKLLTKMNENKNQSRVLEEISMLREALYSIDVSPSKQEILIDDE